MNLAELDPREQWWEDLCAEVAQAAPSRLDSLAASAPDAEQDDPAGPIAATGSEDSTGDCGSGIYEPVRPTSDDPA